MSEGAGTASHQYATVAGPWRGARIAFQNGFWWIEGSGARQRVLLDPLFSKTAWRVGNLATEIGMQRRSFERMAKKSLGITAKEWLRGLRAVRAMHLLAGDNPVGEVAAMSGFANARDFSTEFKRMVGVNPKGFQRGRDSIYREKWCHNGFESG